MKSVTQIAALSFTSIVAAFAIPDHLQSAASVLCTDAPVQTVTVTATAPPVTITESAMLATYSTAESGIISFSTNTAIFDTVTTTATAASSQKTFNIDVGAFAVPGSTAKSFEFRPNNITANLGDLVLFNMLGASHSVTQSEFSTPCTKTTKGVPFDTELQPNMRNQSGLIIERLVVDATTPLWFYCKQQGPPNHCGQGMVFGINPKSNDQMSQFISKAKAQNGNLTGPATATSTASYTAATATSTTTAPFATVTVGLENGTVLRFDPPSLPAVPAGSIIHFDFRAVNHTLTESSFAQPCTKLYGSTVDTNFHQVNKLDQPGLVGYDLEVTTALPRFFYCKQTAKKNHCGNGMVFGLNVDAAQFTAFQSLAQSTGSAAPAMMSRVRRRSARALKAEA